MLARLKPILTLPLIGSLAAVVLGIVCVIVAEYGHLHWIRIIGAILISGGGTAFGIYTGLADPRMLRIPEWLRSYRVTFALLTTALLVIPVVAVLLGAITGLAGDTATSRDTGLLVLGTIVVLLMLAALVATTAISVNAIIRAGREQPRPSGEALEDAP
jgi:hypothetical protein